MIKIKTIQDAVCVLSPSRHTYEVVIDWIKKSTDIKREFRETATIDYGYIRMVISPQSFYFMNTLSGKYYNLFSVKCDLRPLMQ